LESDWNFSNSLKIQAWKVTGGSATSSRFEARTQPKLQKLQDLKLKIQEFPTYFFQLPHQKQINFQPKSYFPHSKKLSRQPIAFTHSMNSLSINSLNLY
jgi:hypothetical protein